MIILVDFENTHINGMEGYEYLNENDTLVLYYSDENSVISKGMAYDLKENGVKVRLVKLLKQHANALDMYIASTTGIYADKGELICIVSKDKGYNAVKDFWNSFIGTEILLGETIESCLLHSSNGADERIKIIKERTEKALLLDSFTCLNDPKKKHERIKNLKKLGMVNKLSFESEKEVKALEDNLKASDEPSNKLQNDIKPIDNEEKHEASKNVNEIKNEKQNDNREAIKATFAVQKVQELPKLSNNKVSYIYDPEKGVMEKIVKSIDVKDVKEHSAEDDKEVKKLNEEKSNKLVEKKEVNNKKPVEKKEVKSNNQVEKKEVNNNKIEKKEVKNNKVEKKEVKNKKPVEKKEAKNKKPAEKKEERNNKPADKKETKTNNSANKKEAKSNNKSLDNNDKKNNTNKNNLKIDNTVEADNRSLDRNKQNNNPSFNAHNRGNGKQQENRNAEKNGKKNKNDEHKVDYDPKKIFDEFSLKADNLHQYYITLTKHFGKDDGIVIYYGTKKMFQQLMKERKSAK